jgi:polar amino acid transport system substrate-binding protein
VNLANPVLARNDGADSGPDGGVAVELARELGRRLGVPVQFLPYVSAAAMADDARTGEWDVAFLAADPAREETIAFSAPYVELDATYLVPAGSAIRALGEVDAVGVRIAARPRSAYDLFLRRALSQATLVYPEEGEADLDVLAKGRADVLAGLRHMLVDTAASSGDWRVLDGRFAAMAQAIGVPRAREEAAAYVRAFVEEVKASGFVARAIAASAAEGVSVAPGASP